MMSNEQRSAFKCQLYNIFFVNEIKFKIQELTSYVFSIYEVLRIHSLRHHSLQLQLLIQAKLKLILLLKRLSVFHLLGFLCIFELQNIDRYTKFIDIGLETHVALKESQVSFIP